MIDQIEGISAGITGNNSLKQTVIVGTFTQGVLHELAYGVFDVLQVPVWGREDDAADRLAAFVLLQFSGEIAHTTMVGSAEFFLLSQKTWTGSAFADTASPEAQRFYNFLCIAYGGDSFDFGGWTQAPKGKTPCCLSPAPNSVGMNTSKFATPSICESCPTWIRICCCRSKPPSGSHRAS